MLQTKRMATVKHGRNMDHFGRLLTQGLKSIAALEKTDVTEVQHELGQAIGVSVWTIYKWRKGTSIPGDDRTIAMLARACVARGRMDRKWLTEFLHNTIYSNKQELNEELFPAKETAITHNLPRRQHKKLIGRDPELAEIRNFLSPRHRAGIVCISGSGGIGKTALALEIAHGFCEYHADMAPDDRFETIIWVTAKSVELLPTGTVQRHPTFTDLDGVYRAIADLMDIPVIFRTATRAEQNIIVTRLLAAKRVLLMLDNLEDLDDPELMIFLRDLPAPSKAIITTRHRIDVAVPIYLHSLDEATACELVQMECERHRLLISDAQMRLLLRRTGGLPLAIIRTIGRMAWRGSTIETEIQHLDDPNNEIYDFCFSKTVALIQRSDAHTLFMALALFADAASREAVGFVAGFGDDPLDRDEGLSDLDILSMCHKDSDHFTLEPLTRTQALAELHTQPEFEATARERWVKWYLDFAARYGGRDRLEMHQLFDYLEDEWNNILALMSWCIDQGRYSDVAAFWNYVRDFTHIYGFWTDRLGLLNWLIGAADNRHDYASAVQFMYDRAFTLTLTGPSARLEEADTLLQRCWSLRQYAPPALQARVAALMASLSIKHNQHAEAHQWLDTGETLLRDAGLEPIELARERTSLLYDRGENWLMMGDYNRAQATFREMLAQGELSGWQRSVLYAQNWLAYTALVQKNPAVSEQYLWQGWSVASRLKERRLSAYFQRTIALYYRETGKPAEALHWAEDALDSFERLGMSPDMHMMQSFIAQFRPA
jgi:hypothetical protein